MTNSYITGVSTTSAGSFSTLATINVERKMIEPNSYAAFSFLLYVVAFCLILTFIYIAVDWLWDRWASIQYNRKREIESLQDQIKDLERKKSGGA